MQTEDDNAPVTIKKKNDKGQQSNDNVIVTLDKTEPKKGDKSDGEDPKPRIVLTFRSEKSGAKNSNMKIVPNDEKHDEFSPRRSSRTRGKWSGIEWSDENETSESPHKEKVSSQPVSENDETSDSSHTSKRMTRRRSKDSSDNVLANAIARKEKSYNESAGPTQRLSRRIKPTAKILANEELRIGLESQNNARLGIQTERTEESGVRTRRSARPTNRELVSSSSTASNKKNSKGVQEEIVIDDDDTNPEKSDDPSAVMKLKHLCELGLKAINPDSLDEEEEDDEEEDNEDDDEDEMEIDDEEDEENEEDLEEDDMDDDSEEVISKLLEADEDSSEDFSCLVQSSQRKKPRRSNRLCFSYYRDQDTDQNSPAPEDDEQKEPPRRSSRRSTRYSNYESDREYCPPRKRNRSGRRAEHPSEDQEEDSSSRSRRLKNRSAKEEVNSEPEQEDQKSEPAGGDEGSEAACPDDDDAAIVATCYCEASSNVHAAPSEITEPVFCQAVECVEGVRVGCSHGAARAKGGAGELQPLRRAGPRAPYLLLCRLHAALMTKHMCCPACGLFCTMGVFYQCPLGHLFHEECALPYGEAAGRGCPHCGVRARRWSPRQPGCRRVRLRMHCGNKRIYLPDQREQCTPAYLSFSTLTSSQLDQTPLIPEELIPPTTVDMKLLCVKTEIAEDDIPATEYAQQLYKAIMANETVENLIPIIKYSAVVNEALPEYSGGSSVHATCARGHLAALHLLRAAGGHLDQTDNGLRTPLMVAVQALVDKSNNKNMKLKKTIEKEPNKEEIALKEEVDEEKLQQETLEDEKAEDKNNTSDIKTDIDIEKPKDEDLMKVIRYLIAAGCDVNIQGPEGMTALHLAAMHGGLAVAEALLDVPAVAVDPRDHGGWTPLVWAAENCHTDIVRLLLSRGAEAATRDAEGNGAVHWCALAGDQHALRMLLDAAPHVRDLPNAHRDTPLHVAARQGHYACVVILLARGARTDLENSAGEVPADVCSGACLSAVSLNMQMAQIVAPHTTNLLSSDISNGREEFPVPCINEVDDTQLPADFTYVTEHVMPEPIVIDNTLATLQGCSCVDGDCSTSACACCALSVRAWAARGRLPHSFPYHDPPMLFECNHTCACNARKCGNLSVSRLLSRGSLGARVCVFRGARRGWGLRAAGAVPRGSAVAAYTGELLPLAAADARADDHYMFALDVKPDLLEQCSDKTLLCVDARHFGSAARFVNHSCRPNLAPVRVFTRTRDLRLPHVILYATRDLRPGDELTFDYGDKFWAVKSKWMKCECGSPDCRYPEKVVDSDS